jgi:uncharacterized lipoprotein YmbA
MKAYRTLVKAVGVAILTVLGVTGCLGRTSPPVDFYTLSPLPRSEGGAAPGASGAVAVGAVMLPAALDRPQIVTRTSDNQVSFSEFHRWAGTLKDDVTRVLIEDLSILVKGSGRTVLSADTAVNPAYRLTVTVNQFDGRLGDKVWLRAVWAIRDLKPNQMIAVRNAVIDQPVAAGDYAALVAAQSRALETLSREIAAEIEKLPR